MKFRKINNLESALYAKASRGRNKKTIPLDVVSVAYVVADNFTTAVVKTASNRLFIGNSKRNPKDSPNQILANNVAFSRALLSASVVL